MNNEIHVSSQISIFSRYMSMSRIAGSYGNSIFTFFKEPSYCFAQWLHQFTFTPTVQESSFSPSSFPAFTNCFSLIISNVEHFHLCLLATYISFLEKGLFRSSAHVLIGLFVFQILSCLSCFCNLESNPLPVALFTNILFHDVDCLFFFFFMVSFSVQKLLSLIRSHLFLFISITLGDGAKQYCCNLCQSVFCLCFTLVFNIHSYIQFFNSL